MATAAALEAELVTFGPASAGIRMRPEEFDEADFEEGCRYELIEEVLVVSPIPEESERDPNEELGSWLRNYQESHPQGAALDKTLPEQIIRTYPNRRRADRAIWAGLGRRPRRFETPTIVAEFVSAGKRNWRRDYEEKRDEFLRAGVKEYWVFDRFRRTLTVFYLADGQVQTRVVKERQKYTMALLPGFELPVGKLLKLADDWAEAEKE